HLAKEAWPAAASWATATPAPARAVAAAPATIAEASTMYEAFFFTFRLQSSYLRCRVDPSNKRHSVGPEGSGPNSFASCGNDRVAQSRTHRHCANLAEAPGLVADRDDLDGDIGSLVDPQKLIGVEVRLLGRSA